MLQEVEGKYHGLDLQERFTKQFMISPRGRSERQGVSKLSAWKKPVLLAPHKRAKGRQDQYAPLTYKSLSLLLQYPLVLLL